MPVDEEKRISVLSAQAETHYSDPRLKKIKDHLSKHNLNDTEFGYYLTGLIEGDGHFTKTGVKTISFSIKDICQAYYIKKRIGFGSVSKVKDKEAVTFKMGSIKGMQKLHSLINGKFRTEAKYTQYMRITDKYALNISPLDTTPLKSNYWLTGFFDADGSYQIKMQSRPGRKLMEIRQAKQIDQKDRQIQDVIQKEFGGSIGHRISQDTYYYSSVNFGVAKRYIDYFDKFTILTYKYVNYINWRKVYIMISEKKHLTLEGVNKISKLKESKRVRSSA